MYSVPVAEATHTITHTEHHSYTVQDVQFAIKGLTGKLKQHWTLAHLAHLQPKWKIYISLESGGWDKTFEQYFVAKYCKKLQQILQY